MNQIEKKKLSEAFRLIRLQHAWSKTEAGMLTTIRDAYESGDEETFNKAFMQLSDALERKRDGLTELYRKLFPEMFGLEE